MATTQPARTPGQLRELPTSLTGSASNPPVTLELEASDTLHANRSPSYSMLHGPQDRSPRMRKAPRLPRPSPCPVSGPRAESRMGGEGASGASHTSRHHPIGKNQPVTRRHESMAKTRVSARIPTPAGRCRHDGKPVSQDHRAQKPVPGEWQSVRVAQGIKKRYTLQVTRRQRAVGTRAALRIGPCHFGGRHADAGSTSTASTCTTEPAREHRSSYSNRSRHPLMRSRAPSSPTKCSTSRENVRCATGRVGHFSTPISPKVAHFRTPLHRPFPVLVSQCPSEIFREPLREGFNDVVCCLFPHQPRQINLRSVASGLDFGLPVVLSAPIVSPRQRHRLLKALQRGGVQFNVQVPLPPNPDEALVPR